ncbi:MAG: ABC transporter permease [bacterium]|jgi:ABC-2 type transport system permease protein
MNSNSLVQLTLLRFREFMREAEAVFWTFVFPVLLAAGLGIAFRNRPPEMVKVATTDPAIRAALSQEKTLSVELLDGEDAREALRMGRVLVLVAPGNPITYTYDNTNADARVARLLADRALQAAAGAKPAVDTADRIMDEPGSRYIDFLIPGLLAMNLLGSGIWGVGFTIVDARRKKLLKRLVASPMPRWQYLCSFVCSRLILLVAEVAVLLGFGAWAFGVPVRAPIWQIGLLAVLASLMFSALGLLLAARPRTIEGVSGIMNMVMLPMWVCSGVFFSASRFPDALQPFIQLLPLTAAVDALRASMLQGTSLPQLGSELAIMVGWLVVCFAVALRLFRWR